MTKNSPEQNNQNPKSPEVQNDLVAQARGAFSDIITNILWKITDKITQNKKILFQIEDKSSLYKDIQKAKKIDINNLTWNDKSVFNEIITNNFPLIQILRIKSNDNIINISFFWVKQINDELWQSFCDDIVWEFKSQVRQNIFHKQKSNSFLSRVVKSDYKNICFTFSHTDTYKYLFDKIENKEDFINIILKNLSWKLKAKAKSIVYETIEKSNKMYSSKQIDNLILEKQKEITNYVLKTFNFWIWLSNVWEIWSDIDKLDTLRQAEIASRQNINSTNITINEYSHENIIKWLTKAKEKLDYIINNFENEVFIFEDTKYRIVNTIWWKKQLTSEFLRYARKFPDKIKPQELAKVVDEYYKELTNSLDFTSPVRSDDYENEFQKAKLINSQVRDGLVDKEFVKQNHKWWLAKEAFFSEVENKKWVWIFIDIKDMWIDNIYDYQLRMLEILSLNKALNNWEIALENYITKCKKILLESWKSVTNKISELQQRITKSYPNAIISFWWDEVFIFLPWSEKANTSKIVWNITKILNITSQKARILYKNMDEKKSKKWLFDNLEKFSKINKEFEKEIEKSILNNNLSLDNLPNATETNFTNTIQQIIRPDFDFKKFINLFVEKVSNLDISNFSKKHDVWMIYEWIKLKIIKKSNETLELQFYK